MAELPDNLILLPMARADIPEIHLLEVISFSLPWEIEAYYGELANPSAFYLAAHAGERIIGFGGMWAVADQAHIVTLAVHPDYRRHGLGRRMLMGLLDEARRRTVTEITLEVRAGNAPAQALYQSAGFRTVAIRRHYYPDNGEDALVMELRVAN
jgi:ribosomal-protein-alanine N-acetyltransferase